MRWFRGVGARIDVAGLMVPIDHCRKDTSMSGATQGLILAIVLIVLFVISQVVQYQRRKHKQR